MPELPEVETVKATLKQFLINEVIEDLKDSIDIEDSNSILFDKYYIGEPIITGI